MKRVRALVKFTEEYDLVICSTGGTVARLMHLNDRSVSASTRGKEMMIERREERKRKGEWAESEIARISKSLGSSEDGESPICSGCSSGALARASRERARSRSG